MAEFRAVGGGMVPHRQPSGRRLLLPAEAELCNAIGLSEDEYWYFVELTQAYNGKRAKEYELIPDAQNNALAVSIISLVIGLASTAASFLLAPKPRAPQAAAQQRTAAPSLRTSDQSGSRRFAPQSSFDSVQELATLGQIVPLIFTRKGVRVSAQLLWSQMLSLGTKQQLRAIMMFGSAIEQRPDFAGFAIGDTLLENYTSAKLALYFRPSGGRLLETADRYPQGTMETLPYTDAFSIFSDRVGSYQPFFSGVRTPSTQTQFGAYSPMPNGNALKVNYELVLNLADADSQVKADAIVKREKIATYFASRAGITSLDSTGATYRIEAGEENSEDFPPWGTGDINSFTESIRTNADQACSVGDLYLVGERFGVGKSLSPNEPWSVSSAKEFRLQWSNESPYLAAEARSPADRILPYENLIIQRAAVAAVTNNRACDATEIGIKSTVWKQVSGFPNVNSQPSNAVLQEYEQRNGSIGLGSLSKYLKRLSFFRIFARPLGSNAAWTDLNNGTLYCVKGQAPQSQYNYIRFAHARGQYEFKFIPVPGNIAYRNLSNQDVYLLKPGSQHAFSSNGYYVVFSGERYRLSPSAQSNREWILGKPPADSIGSVVNVSSTQKGTIPVTLNWVLVDTRNSDGNKVESGWLASATANQQLVSFKWDSEIVGSQPYNNGDLSALTLGDAQYRAGSDGSVRTLIAGRQTYIEYTASILRYELRNIETPTSEQVVTATGGSGSGLKFNVKTYSNGAASWYITAGGTGYNNAEQVFVPVANINVRVVTDTEQIFANNLHPYDAVADFPLYEAERTSHMDGPEHEIVYVSEQLEQVPPQYDSLALTGIRINSAEEWTSFSSLSAFIKKGTVVERLTTSGSSATNLVPEIAYALLTDTSIGAGISIGTGQVDRDRMVIAARFCEANGFTWDGTISERVNLREWIFEQAGYCMLDFTILGGRFSLVPSVPYNNNFTINYAGRPEIKALFTDGNIRNMKVSWLSPEERRLFKATCLWRQDKDNGFPETKVLSVRLADSEGGKEGDPEETFDMSGWCTTQQHAYTFARYALKLRQLIDHSVSFETTPQAAMNLAPGEYFRLVSEVTHTSRFNNGSVGSDGAIQSTDVLSGSYPILYWQPGTVGVQSTTLQATNGRTAQTSLFNTVFAINNSTTVNRVYKVETLSYGEDGLVEVAASYVPLTSAGSLATLDWDDSMFVTEVS